VTVYSTATEIAAKAAELAEAAGKAGSWAEFIEEARAALEAEDHAALEAEASAALDKALAAQARSPDLSPTKYEVELIDGIRQALASRKRARLQAGNFIRATKKRKPTAREHAEISHASFFECFLIRELLSASGTPQRLRAWILEATKRPRGRPRGAEFLEIDLFLLGRANDLAGKHAMDATTALRITVDKFWAVGKLGQSKEATISRLLVRLRELRSQRGGSIRIEEGARLEWGIRGARGNLGLAPLYPHLRTSPQKK
jgi:hypothetical protein